MKRITKIIALLLIILQLFAIGVSAKDKVLSLYKNSPEDGTPFNVSNMFPGDVETKLYNVRVSYTGSIKVYFTADVRPGYEKLAEVLKCKVDIKGRNKTLYDGLMKDMPDLEHSLNGVNKTEYIQYDISVYLDTGVGNEYKNTQLIADFKWWAYTANEGKPGGVVYPDAPKPGTSPDDKDPKPSTPPQSSDEPVPTPGGDEPVPTPGGDEPVPTPGGDEPVPTPGGDEPMPTPGGDEPEPPVTDVPQPTPGTEPTPDDGDRPTGELINPPKTGDLSNPVLWIVLICVSLLVIFLLLFFRKKKDKKPVEKSPVVKKLTACIIVIVILAICLCITTFALVYSIINVDENIFRTGTVEININDGQPIINRGEYLFEPGMTVVKDFFVKNESTDAVYYKVYFDEITGGLAYVLDVEITEKESGKLLFSGKAAELIRENCDSGELAIRESRILTAKFHYPPESGNDTQNMSLTFDLCAVATQQRNNPAREF